MTEFLIQLWDEHLHSLGFELGTPRESKRRGSHVTLSHTEGWRINQALIDRARVIPDFRPPRHLRFGLCPLYTKYAEIATATDALARVVKERWYESYPKERGGVT
jgi:kynureninase